MTILPAYGKLPRRLLLSAATFVALLAGPLSALAQTANLTVSKTDGVATRVPGTTTTYTILVTNLGPDPDPAATITDTFPAAIVGATWTCSASAGSSCTGAGAGNIADVVNLLAGGTLTYTVTAPISGSATGMLTNTVTVGTSGGIIDPNLANNTASDTDTLNPTANLGITKTDGAATEIPGTAISYTIVVSNAGPSDVTNAPVTDTFAAALTGVTWTCVASVGSSCAAPAGAGNIGTTVSLLSAGTATFTVNATIDGSATGMLSNTASVAAPGGVTDPVAANNSATDTDSLTPQADLSITKTDGSATEIPGTAISYTIVVSNAGPSNVTAAPVTDTFPAAITGVTWTCSASLGSSCAAPLGVGNISQTVNLLSGGSATYTVSGTIAASAVGMLSNTATVTAPMGVTDSVAGNNSATDTDTLTPEADLSVVKTDGQANEVPGTAVAYTITVTNAGPSNAVSATVTDTFPAALTSVTWTCSATAGSFCTPAGAGNIADLPTILAGGTLTYTVNAVVDPGATGMLSNTATVAVAMGTTDPDLSDNSSTDTDTLIPEADLDITKDDGTATAIPGTSTTYTITVSNLGPSDAPIATVTDNFPADIVGATWTCGATVGSSCTAAGAGNISDGVVLLAGGSVIYTVTAPIDPAATGNLVNTATITIGGGVTDPNALNNSDTDTDLLTPQADLSVTKTDGAASSVPGTPISYTITVTSAGPSDAPNTTVTDTFSADLTGVTWSCVASAGSSCTGAGAGNINDAVTILTGGTLTYTVNATIDACATGVLNNTATATTGGGVTDPVAGNNSATDSNVLTPIADLQVVSKVDNIDPILVCNYLTYTVTLQNNGPSCATGVTLTDALPANVDFLSSNPVSPTCTSVLNTVTCGLGTLNPGAMSVVTIVTIPDFPTKGTTVTNTASVTSATTDSDLLNNSGSQSTEIKPVDPIILTKTGAPRFLRRGILETMTYDLKVTSLCAPEAIMTNVTVTDTMPDGLDFVTSVPAPTSRVGNVLTYVFPTLPGEGIETIGIEATLNSATTPGTTLRNSATVTNDQGCQDDDSFTGGLRAEANNTRKLKLTFTSVHNVQPGATLNSTLVVDSVVGVAATNVVLVLDSPNDISFVSADPPPTSTQNLGTTNRITWTFAELDRKKVIRLIQSVSANATEGTVYVRGATVQDSALRSGSASRQVRVKKPIGTRTPTQGVTQPPTFTPQATPTRTPTGPAATPTATRTNVPGALSITHNLPTNITAGGSMNTQIIVDSTSLATGVTVTLEYPSSLTLSTTSTSPVPQNVETSNGRSQATWSLSAVGHPIGRGQIQVRHSVPANLAAGTTLEFSAAASASGQSPASTSGSVSVRD